ncbi:unnamed protein product [Caenorhabditis auriculariae]|uniref:protein-tyrosine-phosphatase n=1 Tax=Caenorhabditis auriculariae TaxID=2777116 RepID=A0A8S1HE40_9PELO|nr:unnamed protein product [Caenorhabditis auriculariae]
MMTTRSTPSSSIRPRTVRSRTSSTGGLDSNQLHVFINKKFSFGSATPPNIDVHGDSFSAITTRSISQVSMTSVVSPTSSVQSENQGPRSILVAPAPETKSENSSESTPSETAIVDVEQASKMPPQRILYLGETVWQIDDFVYVASIEASVNMSLLCRFKIEYICEITDESSERHVQSKRVYILRPVRSFDCPCLCSRPNNHFRHFLTIDVPESEDKCIEAKFNMVPLFEQFNEWVANARKAGKCVLVCSTTGQNRAPTFAVAHLMAQERVPRWKASGRVTQKLKSMRPPLQISDFMQRSLMRYQVSLGIEPDTAYVSDHSLKLFHIKKRTPGKKVNPVSRHCLFF